MTYFVQLTTGNRRALVVGAGSVAHAKVLPLLDAGYRITVVAPSISAEIRKLSVELVQRPFQNDDLEDVSLVVSATNDRVTNQAVAGAARQRGVLVNVVDDPELCDFFVPALVERGPLRLAIGTGGRSPILSAQVRKLLDAVLPPTLTEAAELFARLRTFGLKGLARRRRVLELLSRADSLTAFDAGGPLAAHPVHDAVLDAWPQGHVVIVGAGPGHRDFLTLKGLRRIAEAEVLLHDGLVDPSVLELATHARVVDVGRRCGRGGVSELPIPRLIVQEARAGRRVVRLHAGDPFVFGRATEEIDALEAAGLPYEVVPGVSSILAAAAAARAPLTHRGEARGFSVRTGHTVSGYSSGELPKHEETVVVLMGLGAIEQICEGLIDEGREPDTPAYVVSAAGGPRERVVTGTLSTIALRTRQAGLESPATIVVGRVAGRARATSQVSPSEAA